jgi:hypothetical protein
VRDATTNVAKKYLRFFSVVRPVQSILVPLLLRRDGVGAAVEPSDGADGPETFGRVHDLDQLEKTTKLFLCPCTVVYYLTLKPKIYISGRKKSSSQDCWPGVYLEAKPFCRICGNAGTPAVLTRIRRRRRRRSVVY